MFRSHSRVSAVAAIVAAAVLGGVTVSVAQTDSGDTIRACYQKSNGALRFLPDGENCKDSERSLDWNKRGRDGLPGEPGEPGAPGDPGQPGPAGVNSIDALSGTACRVGTPEESTLDVTYNSSGVATLICTPPAAPPPPPADNVAGFYAPLSGVSEVPPNPSPARGDALVFLDADAGRLCASLDWSGLASPTGAHIHHAPAGANGPVIFPLDPYLDETTEQCFAVSPEQASELRAGNFYVNVHTTQYPGGEIRGQLRPAARALGASMNGSNEVPPTHTVASGVAAGELTGRRLCFDASWSAITGYTGSHVHRAPAGTNGPVVVNLAPNPGASSVTDVCAPADAALYGSLAREELYVNVHSTQYPGGEIRGQLRPA